MCVLFIGEIQQFFNPFLTPESQLNVSEFIIPFKHFYFSQCHIAGLKLHSLTRRGRECGKLREKGKQKQTQN